MSDSPADRETPSGDGGQDEAESLDADVVGSAPLPASEDRAYPPEVPLSPTVRDAAGVEAGAREPDPTPAERAALHTLPDGRPVDDLSDDGPGGEGGGGGIPGSR